MDRLTGSEQKIARVLLENSSLIETHTATELAQLAGVSKATAARFFRALGYTDFEEVRLQAREERSRTQPYRYRLSSPQQTVLGRSISDHLELELNNITRTFEELGPDYLRRAAHIIKQAPRAWFLAIGTEGGVARYGRLLFSRLRHDVHVLGDSDGNWAENLAMTGPQDVLVVMTLEPRPKNLASILSYARTSRMTIITLTDDSFMAQAKRVSDVVIRCHIGHYGPVPTHTTIISMLRLLAVTYVGLDGDTACQRIGLIDDINEELGTVD